MAGTHPPFIHLRVHTAFSLSQGALRIDEVLDACQTLRMPAVAITDTNNMFGVMEFSAKMAMGGVQPIIGVQVALKSTRAAHGAIPTARERPHEIALLAQNETGYRNLLALMSVMYLGKDSEAEPLLDRTVLTDHAAGLICLSGGIDGPLTQPLLKGQKAEAEQNLLFFRDIFADRFYIEIQRHGLPEQDKIENDLIDLAYAHHVPLVATNNCHFRDRSLYEAHDVLLANAEGATVSNPNRTRLTPEHYFKSADEMGALFRDLPEAVENTVRIAKRCAFMPTERKPILPPFPVEQGRTEAEDLTLKARAGLQDRLDTYVLPALPADMPADEKAARAQPYWQRLDYELGVITQMGFSGYFLIVSDFMQWCVRQNIPIGPGRGSGAGSVVAWALKITGLDPLRWGLLFERFLNPERVSMPDFDIDFCQDRRDEVIDYVAQKYGRDKVAQIITFGKLQARAVLRDVGRVLEMSYGEVDRIAKLVPHNPASPVTLSEAIETDETLRRMRDEDPRVARLLDIALKLEGLYRHASTHAAGVVIGDRPLDALIPLYRDPRSTTPVTQFDMKMVEKAGLVKFDFLGLKTLTVLQRTAELLHAKGIPFDLHNLPLDDAKTFAMLARADTTGVFQLESAGMRDVLRKLVPDRFEDLIAVVALYRPGPMENIPLYIDCKHGRRAPDYLHPSLEPILKETYGIMIYQEQVMEIAKVLSGYSLGSADLLRRAMGKKIKEEMDAQRKNFVDGAVTNHVTPDKASHIFDQVAKFAGYGFNKSHAAAYAYVAYQTAYLKANYPHEFMAATMTYDMGNTDKLNIFRQELQRLGIRLLPPSVQHAHVDFRVEDAGDGIKAIRYALGAIKGAGAAAMQSLVTERDAGGAFASITDLVTRMDPKLINKRQLEALICSGALDEISPHRAALHAGMDVMLSFSHVARDEKQSQQNSLFTGNASAAAASVPLPSVRDWSATERLSREFDVFGFYFSAHPLDQYRALLSLQNVKTIHDLNAHAADWDGRVVTLSGIVHSSRERTSAKGNKFAFVTLSDATATYEVTVFSEALKNSRELLVAGQALMVKAEVQVMEDGYRLTAFAFEPLQTQLQRKGGDFVLALEPMADLDSVLGALKGVPLGKSRVFLDVAADGQRVEIDLARRFAVDLPLMELLRDHAAILTPRDEAATAAARPHRA